MLPQTGSDRRADIEYRWSPANGDEDRRELTGFSGMFMLKRDLEALLFVSPTSE